MSLETFKALFHKLPTTVCQIAFGIGDINANPDLFKIMEYCRFKVPVLPKLNSAEATIITTLYPTLQ